MIGTAGDVYRDFLWTLRVFRSRWKVYLFAIAGLALAIGGAASAFALLDVLMFRGPAVSAPDTVVQARRVSAVGSSNLWPIEEYEQALSFGNRVAVAAWTETEAVWSVDGYDIESPIGLVSNDFFSTLGVPASVGRVFNSEDLQSGNVVPAVLSHTFWSRRLGANKSIIGQEVSIGTIRAEVVGVAAHHFTGLDDPTRVAPAALWMPLASVTARADYQREFGTAASSVKVGGRLAHGTSLSEAQAELSALAAVWSDQRGAQDRPRVHLTHIEDARFEIGPAAVVLGAVGLITLLAALNVANLLLAGVVARRTEFAVRSALGASKGRISRQLIIEGVVIGAVSGSAGLLLAYWGAPVFAQTLQVPEYIPVVPRVATVIFTLIAAASVGLCIGALLALYWLRSESVLGVGAGPSAVPLTRWTRGFIVVQAGISTLFVIVAMLFMRADRHLAGVDYGFDIDQVVEMSALRVPSGAPADIPWNELLDRFREAPGIERAALSRFSPLMPRASGNVHVMTVSAEYFSVMGLRILRGRAFTENEVAEPLAVITERVARDYWGSENPIGDNLRRVSARSADVTVVGIVGDSVTNRLGWPESGVIYRPLSRPQPSDHALIRFATPVTAGSLRSLESRAASVQSKVRMTIWPLARYRAMESSRVQRLRGLVTAIGGVTLVLAVLGVVGVTAFGVGQRTREIAVRLALGATPLGVLFMLMRENLKPLLLGSIAGVVLAGSVGGLLRNFLAGISSWDPLAAATAVAVFLVAGIIAVWVPAQRVGRIDPARILKE